MITAPAYFITNSILLWLFVSICLHNRAFYQMFEHTIRQLDESNEIHKDDKKILYELIQFHVMVKE